MNKKIKLIFLTLLIYGVPLAVFSFLPFYKNLFGAFQSTILNLLLYQKLTYSALGVIFDFLIIYCIFLVFRKEIILENSRVYSTWCAIKKIFRFVFIRRMKEGAGFSHEEKISLLFYFVKLVFTPVMMNFLIGNATSLIYFLQKPNSFEFTKENIVNSYFYLAFYLILVLDTLIFAFGYLVESKSLKNIVKSVEPTALGWLVALICYPPFNNLTGGILGWYSSDFSNFGNIDANLITGFLSVLFFAIYVWASIALGFKASNLTNREIVSKGPYKYVRHPAYISKNLSWWVMGIPFIQASGLVAIFSLAAWSFIYFLRALTEERHLRQDPDYIEYAKKVKYMFLPGIF